MSTTFGRFDKSDNISYGEAISFPLLQRIVNFLDLLVVTATIYAAGGGSQDFERSSHLFVNPKNVLSEALEEEEIHILLDYVLRSLPGLKPVPLWHPQLEENSTGTTNRHRQVNSLAYQNLHEETA